MRQSKKSTHRGPVRVSEILPQILARHGFSRTLDYDALLKAWNDAVAPFLPATLHSEIGKNLLIPGEIKRGVLRIQVKNPAFIQELSFHETEIVAKLNETVPGQKIRKIRYIL